MVFFPIIMMLGLIILIVLLLKRSKLLSINILNGRRIYLMLGGYIVILLIAVGVFFLSPLPSDLINGENMAVDNILDSYTIYNDVVENDKSIESFSDYIDEQWEFEFTGNRFSIESINNDASITVIIEKNTEEDGLLEVTSYQTPTVAKGIDVTSYLDPVNIAFSSNTLQIEEKDNEFNLVAFEEEFIFKQFSATEPLLYETDAWDVDESEMDEWRYDEVIHLGETLLYIRIPKGVKVEAHEYLHIEYVNEK